MRKYSLRYFSFQIRYQYQQVCFTRGKTKVVIFYKYLWHYDLPRFDLKSNNDEADFKRILNGGNIKCCSQTKMFSYRFMKTCLSQQFQMFNKNTEGMWCVSLNYVQCNIFYMNVFCQFLAIYMSAWMWCKIWRLPKDTDDSNGLELFIGNLSKEPSENSY